MSKVEKSFVTDSATHFCYKCGWIDDLDTVLEKRTFQDINGKMRTEYYNVDAKQHTKCPECSKNTVLPMTISNTVHAITYLMKALR